MSIKPLVKYRPNQNSDPPISSQLVEMCNY